MGFWSPNLALGSTLEVTSIDDVTLVDDEKFGVQRSEFQRCKSGPTTIFETIKISLFDGHLIIQVCINNSRNF